MCIFLRHKIWIPVQPGFMEAFLFGGLKTDYMYPLEQNFSTFGAHIEDEQDALLGGGDWICG